MCLYALTLYKQQRIIAYAIFDRMNVYLIEPETVYVYRGNSSVALKKRSFSSLNCGSMRYLYLIN